MIGVVIVSHSARLAEGVAELAEQAAQGRVRVAAAGGTGDESNPIGTDAFRVLAAIEAVFSEDGVLVLMDLGSAVLSAETAVEFLEESRQPFVRLCPGPVVEGAVAAVSVAAAGCTLDEASAEAVRALEGKIGQLAGGVREFEGGAAIGGRAAGRPAVAAPEREADAGGLSHGAPVVISAGGVTDSTGAFSGEHATGVGGLSNDTAFGGGTAEVIRPAGSATGGGAADAGALFGRLVVVPNPLGLHARPATKFIRLARGFDARVTVENTSRPGPADGGSLNGILGLGARKGSQLHLRARGPEAPAALDALAAFIASGCGDDPVDAPRSTERAVPAEGALSGIPASAGFAVGPLFRLHVAAPAVARRRTGEAEPEWRRLQSALSEARSETRTLYEWARNHAGENEAGIFDAQALFLEDPALLEPAKGAIFDDGLDAASAWQSASEAMVRQLFATGDPYFSARAGDIADAGGRVLRRLTGAEDEPLTVTQPSILAGYDLLPSQVEKLDPALILGVCLESGSASAHSAILARARGIPAVVGVGPALASIPEGRVVAMDGERGVLRVDPPVEECGRFEQRRREWLASREVSHGLRTAPARTADGVPVTILANLSRESEAAEAIEYGAEGVGVLRTEFLFLHRRTAPSEEEQFTAYRNIASVMGGRPLVIRTLDIGGDKAVPYIDIGAESNPFLGWRGVRLTLGQPELFETQLRAIVRVAAEGFPVEVLLPMVSTPSELREAKAIVRGLSPGRDIPVGVMIEVPAAVSNAIRLAPEVSRLSIGTNDLVQYLMAADRTNSRVAKIADYFQPAVLQAIRQVVESGRPSGTRVDVCGEMGADPRAVPLLLGLGIRELSVSPPLIPELKRAIARWTIAEAEALARQALDADSSEAVRALVAGAT